MSELAKRFGARVRTIRMARSLTQPQLADAVSMSEEWVRRIERGGGSPSFDTIEALCRALEVEPVDLFIKPDETGRLNQILEHAKDLSVGELTWIVDLMDVVGRRPKT